MSNETKKGKPVVKPVVKPEMTVEQLVEKWGWPYAEEGWKMEDCTEELRADLRSVIQGRLVEYDKWLCGNSERLLNIPTSEQAVDEFLKDNQ